MGALDYIKAAIELAKRAGQVDLQKQLMDAREEFNDLREANHSLMQEVGELKEQLRRAQGGVFWREPWYYTSNEDEEEDGPFCPNCYDTKKLLVRAPRREVSGGGVLQTCPSCNFERWEREPRAESFE
jgi:hypothetical protein